MHDVFTEALEGNVMEVDVENIEINVKLTCPLVKDAAKRFVKSLKKEFQEFLFPKLPAVEKKDVLLMFCDPRLKKWILSFRNGSLMNGVTRNVKLNLKKIFQKTNELETEPEDDDVTEIEQPDPKKARLARKFKFGNIETVKNVESSSDTIEEIFTILKNLDSFNKNPMLLDVKDEAFCPFKWWLEVVEKKPFLEPLMKKIFISLAEKLASSFSEQIFSFAARTSKGDQ